MKVASSIWPTWLKFVLFGCCTETFPSGPMVIAMASVGMVMVG